MCSNPEARIAVEFLLELVSVGPGIEREGMLVLEVVIEVGGRRQPGGTRRGLAAGAEHGECSGSRLRPAGAGRCGGG